MEGGRGRGSYHLNIIRGVAAAATTPAPAPAVGDRTSRKGSAVRLGEEFTRILVEASE